MVNTNRERSLPSSNVLVEGLDLDPVAVGDDSLHTACRFERPPTLVQLATAEIWFVITSILFSLLISEIETVDIMHSESENQTLFLNQKPF